MPEQGERERRGRGTEREREGGRGRGRGRGGSPVPSQPTHSRWKDLKADVHDCKTYHLLFQKLEALVVEDLHKFTLEVLIAVPRSSRH